MTFIEAAGIAVIVILSAIAVTIFVTVAAASVLVTFAVRSEEMRKSLGGPSRGRTTRLARRVLAMPDRPRVTGLRGERPVPSPARQFWQGDRAA